ncbi:MAG: menaquinone biosynthesis protein [Bacteroidetes bacterium]|nr:menaquinone biosynthesis protein [Bacteroidota bacterium]
MDRKIRVGAVSYLNTKPLIYGMEEGMLKEEVDLLLDTPANIAARLLRNEIDCGLVPVATITAMEEYHIISDYGIAAKGEVASVCIFSECRLEEVEEILLDYQSATSVRLVKILLKEYWKLTPRLVDTRQEFEHLIKGKTAAVLIGDRALAQRSTSNYVYDLAEAWVKHTSLPFVFAAWISNKALSPAFCKAFDAANRYGLERLDQVIAAHPYPSYDLHHYYTENIHFYIGDAEKKGLALFLEKLKQYQISF